MDMKPRLRQAFPSSSEASIPARCRGASCEQAAMVIVERRISWTDHSAHEVARLSPGREPVKFGRAMTLPAGCCRLFPRWFTGVIERSGGRHAISQASREQLMSSFSEQDPNDPEFYAPLRLRERAAKLGPSVSQEARSEPIGSSPISLPASRDNALWKPLDPQVIN